jgi:hypothetical protein
MAVEQALTRPDDFSVSYWKQTTFISPIEPMLLLSEPSLFQLPTFNDSDTRACDKCQASPPVLLSSAAGCFWL